MENGPLADTFQPQSVKQLCGVLIESESWILTVLFHHSGRMSWRVAVENGPLADTFQPQSVNFCFKSHV